MPSFLRCCPPLDQGFLYGRRGLNHSTCSVNIQREREREERNGQVGPYTYVPCTFR